MKDCPWERINEFDSLGEFNGFVDWIAEQTKSAAAEEVPVVKPYLGGNTFREKWFRHVRSESVWRLVWPDGPFHGVFEPVE
jgi:hypothetical protein